MPVIFDEQFADALDEESNPRRAWKVELACSRPDPQPRIAPFVSSFPVIQHDLEEIRQ